MTTFDWTRRLLAAVMMMLVPLFLAGGCGPVEGDTAMSDPGTPDEVEFVLVFDPAVDPTPALEWLRDAGFDAAELAEAEREIAAAQERGRAFYEELRTPGIEKGCSYKRHYYYGSCQDGVSPWGPCAYCESCDHDWRMVYTRSGSGYYSSGSMYSVSLSWQAMTATLYYKVRGYSLFSAYTVGWWSPSGSQTGVWVMMGDNAVNALWGGDVDEAGADYAIYNRTCN